MPKRRSALIASNFQSADVAVTQNQFTEIGRHVVGSGMYLTLGYGFSNSQVDADGRIYALIKDTADATLEGTLLISIYTPEDRHHRDLFEARTEDLNSSLTDRQKQIPFPEMDTGYGKDWIYKIFFKPDATGKTVDNGLTKIVMTTTIEPKF